MPRPADQPAGTRVMFAGKMATVVARPLKMRHLPDQTPLVIDGDCFVIYALTKDVRLASEPAPAKLTL